MSRVRVEVVYALPTQQWVAELELDAGATVRDALERVQDEDGFSALDLARMSVGIWGKIIDDLDRVLSDEDRVELYRGLVMDPMTARRARASASRKRRVAPPQA